MMTTKDQIASRLEQAFALRGFSEPGVAELKVVANVSLRTLYRYFPSKESMVVGALDFRHGRYLKFLADGEPPRGKESIVHLFRRLVDWMHIEAPNGCLEVNAFAAYPSSAAIRSVVKNHKEEIVRLLKRRSGQDALGWELFLLHEGLSSAWPMDGPQASSSVEKAVLKLFDGGKDD